MALVLALGVCGASASVIRLQSPAAPIPTPVFAPAAKPAGLSPALSPSLTLAPALAAPAISLSPVLAAPAQAAPRLILPGAPRPEPVARAEKESGNDFYGGMFDGSTLEGPEGEQVSPRLVSPGDVSLRLPLQAAAVRGAVERALPALRESVALGSWNGPRTTLDESCCGDAAPKLAVLLRGRGIPARLVEAEFHYYVILDLPDGQLIVDPTIRQFFGKKGAPRSVPTVFVGTIAELHTLFRQHQAAKTTRYDPQRIYFSDARTREDYLRRVEADIRLGGPRDLEPLRRHLGLSDSPQANRPLRLIVP